jgi:hypothetical protein
MEREVNEFSNQVIDQIRSVSPTSGNSFLTKVARTVAHSQRINENPENAWVIRGHCTCMAGTAKDAQLCGRKINVY